MSLRRLVIIFSVIACGTACGVQQAAAMQLREPALQSVGSPPAAVSSRGLVLDADALDADHEPGFGGHPERDFAAARQQSQSSNSPFRSQPIDDDVQGSPQTLPLTTVFSSLAIVLGLFGALVWVLKRSGGAGMSSVSKETLQVLGRTPLAPRQNIVLVRCGRRILVLAVGGTNTATLAEISDPDEVNELLAACSSTGGRQQFLQTLNSMGKEKPNSKRFIDTDPDDKPKGLFASA